MNVIRKTKTSIIAWMLAGIVIMTFGFVLMSCDDGDEYDEHVANTNFFATEEFNYSLPAENRTCLYLSANNGTVDVAAGIHPDSVIITGFRRVESESVADAEEHLSLLRVIVEPNANDITVRTGQPQLSEGRNYIVDYEVRLPAAWNAVVNQANGTVNVDSIRGGVNAQVVNGELRLWDISGGAHGNVTNGSITCRMTLLPGGRCTMSTVNGTIGLQIPATTSAALSANVVNGAIGITGLILNNAVITPTNVTGTLGGGNGAISLGTTNGSILIGGY